jgi:hypothetical protein
MMGICECSNEPSGLVKAGNFLISFSGRTLLSGVGWVGRSVCQSVSLSVSQSVSPAEGFVSRVH